MNIMLLLQKRAPHFWCGAQYFLSINMLEKLATPRKFDESGVFVIRSNSLHRFSKLMSFKAVSFRCLSYEKPVIIYSTLT